MHLIFVTLFSFIGAINHIYAASAAGARGVANAAITPIPTENLQPPLYECLPEGFQDKLLSPTIKSLDLGKMDGKSFQILPILAASAFLKITPFSFLGHQLKFYDGDNSKILAPLLPMAMRANIAQIFQHGFYGMPQNYDLARFFSICSRDYSWDEVMLHALNPEEMHPYLVGYLEKHVGMGTDVPIWKIMQQCSRIIDYKSPYVLMNRIIKEILQIDPLEGKAQLGSLYATMAEYAHETLTESSIIDRLRIMGLRLLEESADAGITSAQYKLAVAYQDGKLGLPVDLNKALQRYGQALMGDNPQAQYRYAKALELGHLGLPADPEKAVRFYQLASEQGYSVAQFKLAKTYENGGLIGIAKDPRIAIRLYRLAAFQGHFSAQENLTRLEDSLRPSQAQEEAAKDELVMYAPRPNIIPEKNLQILRFDLVPTTEPEPLRKPHGEHSEERGRVENTTDQVDPLAAQVPVEGAQAEAQSTGCFQAIRDGFVRLIGRRG